ncbi:unnamed protein product, partial [Ectocarpus fasciculatus]
ERAREEATQGGSRPRGPHDERVGGGGDRHHIWHWDLICVLACRSCWSQPGSAGLQQPSARFYFYFCYLFLPASCEISRRLLWKERNGKGQGRCRGYVMFVWFCAGREKFRQECWRE